MRTIRAGLAALALALGGVPGASAQAADVPANGVITITNQGFGLTATWTYDGATIDCEMTTDGPGGVPQIASVKCKPVQGNVLTYSCPLMVVTRTTATVVGARARCEHTLDMGIGTSGAATANLGRLQTSLFCEAYVDSGVLVPPFTVTCSDPGLPSRDAGAA